MTLANQARRVVSDRSGGDICLDSDMFLHCILLTYHKYAVVSFFMSYVGNRFLNSIMPFKGFFINNASNLQLQEHGCDVWCNNISNLPIQFSVKNVATIKDIEFKNVKIFTSFCPNSIPDSAIFRRQ